MNKDTLKSKKRYDLIDSIRGFAVINMVAFHALYDIFIIYGDGFYKLIFCRMGTLYLCIVYYYFGSVF